MWPARSLSSSDTRAYLEPVPLRRRVVSIGLTIAAHLLILLLLLRLAPPFQPREVEHAPSTFSMLPDDSQAAPKPAAKAKANAKAAKASAAAPAPRPPLPVTIPKPAPATPTDKPPTILWDKALYAAADVGKIKGTANDADGDATGKDSSAAYGPGEGPGGARLYNAQWYREPTTSELSTYLPANVPPGSWGMIACRTIANYHVENCRQLGESPAGSGISRGMREAAWQFMVRPPRLGGKAMIGEWVRIRIDFTEHGIK